MPKGEQTTHFEKRLVRRAEQLEKEFCAEASRLIEQLMKNKYPEINRYDFPRMTVYLTQEYGSGYEVKAHFETTGDKNKEVFQKLAYDRFEKGMDNLRWVFENGSQQ